MKQAAEYAICYDISDNHERARVDKVLKGYGFRVQKSELECHLTRNGKNSLIATLLNLGLKNGSITFYRLYAGAAPVTIGLPAPTPDDEFSYTL